MSSTNKTTNYQLSQFVGTDIPSILNDYNGDMRKIDTAIKEVAIAGGDSATAIAELQSTTARHTTEINGLTATVNNVSGRVVGVEESLTAVTTDVGTLQTDLGELQEEVSDMGGDVKAIQLCVPATASESNKFATMNDISGAKSGVFFEDNTEGRSLNDKLNAFMHYIIDNYGGDDTESILNAFDKIMPYLKIRLRFGVSPNTFDGVYQISNFGVDGISLNTGDVCTGSGSGSQATWASRGMFLDFTGSSIAHSGTWFLKRNFAIGYDTSGASALATPIDVDNVPACRDFVVYSAGIAI